MRNMQRVDLSTLTNAELEERLVEHINLRWADDADRKAYEACQRPKPEFKVLQMVAKNGVG
jgi:hypothetical protein